DRSRTARPHRSARVSVGGSEGSIAQAYGRRMQEHTSHTAGTERSPPVQFTVLFNTVERKGILIMEQNTDQAKLLQALYQDYLTQSIQLREQLAQAQLRIQELEAQLEAGTESSEAA